MQKRLAIYIIVLVAVAIIIAGGMKFYETTVLSDDARTYVLEDLRANNPDADVVEIFSWESSTNEEGEQYYLIRARATEGLYTPCPKRTHYIYYYPEQNFVTQPPERITVGCRVCEGNGCVIAFPEEAIIASHTNSGSTSMQSYLDRYTDAVPSVSESETEWAVSWRSESAPYGYDVQIAKDGEIIRIVRA